MMSLLTKLKTAAKGPPILGVAWWCLFGAGANAESPDPGPGRIVTTYALTAPAHQDPDQHDGSTPKDWRLLASNDDGRTWQTIDARTNELFGQNNMRRVFAVSNQISYNIYRLEVTRTRDATDTASLAELELMGPVTGVTNQAQLRMRISSSRAHSLRSPATQAFDGNPATDWFDFGLGPAGGRWLQCQYTTNADIVVDNIAQLILIGRGSAMQDSFAGQTSQMLSKSIAQTNVPVRRLVGYSLTSANDFFSRDPTDWQLLASHDGGKSWDVLDVRRNQTFPRRLQKRDFALQKPAAYALYRLQIDAVFLPASANGVQVAEIEPHWAEGENTAGLSLVVSARGENEPWEVTERAFDRDLTTKWLDFSPQSSNRASWVQWQFAALNGPPVVGLNRLRAVRPQQTNPVKLDLQAVVVARGGQDISVVDRSGFEVIHLTLQDNVGHPGDRVRLKGVVEFVNGKPLLMHPELTVLGQVQTNPPVQPGQLLQGNQDYVLGSFEGDAEYLTQNSNYATIRLTCTNGPSSVLARILNLNRRRLLSSLNCRLRVRGVVEAVADDKGQPIPGIVWVTNLNDVTLVATDKDWNRWPEYSVRDLAGTNFIPQGLVRVTGMMGDQKTGEYPALIEGTNRIVIYTGESNTPPRNSRAETAGFLGRESGQTILRWAVCRPAVAKNKPSAMAIDAEHPVTEIGEVNRLRQINPDRAFPVRLRGVITYICGSYIADENIFYLQDGANAIQLLNATAAGLTAAMQQEGMYVEIVAVNSRDGVCPTRFAKLLGKAQMPEPIRNSLSAMVSPQNAGRWAQVEGVVSDYNDGRLTLLVEGKELTVWVNQIMLGSQCRVPGCRLRVSGVRDPIVNSRDQFLGSRLLVPSAECIQIVDPGPADPFLLPNVAIASVLPSSPGATGGQMQMVRSEGVVTYKGPQMLCLQDKDSGMRVFLQRALTNINPGDRVQVAGLPLPDGFSPKLVQALARKIGRADLPAARDIDFMQNWTQSGQDGTRVQVDAIFEGRGTSDSSIRMEFRCEATKRDFYAYLPAASSLPASLLTGSRVRLRGAIKLEVEEPLDANQVVTAFEMYLSSPADIQVLAAPSWWTAGHTLWVTGGLGTVLLVSLGWVGALRGQVRRQTRALKQENAERKQAQAGLAAANAALQKENLERKQAEAEVRRREETSRRIADRARILAQAIEQCPVSVVITDSRGKITYINPKFTQVTGYSFQEAAGQNPRILKSGKTPPEEYKRMWETIRAGGEWSGILQNRKKNGELFWESATIGPVLDEAGEITHYLAVKEDITARRQAEELLRSQEERTHLMIDQAFDAVVTTDMDSRIIGWNRAAEKTLGWTQAEILGSSLIETIVPPGRRERRRADFKRFRATEKWSDPTGLIQTTAVHRDGRELPVEVTTTPVRVGGNWIFTLFLRDITERQQAEAALARERHLLESLLENSLDYIYFKDRESRFVRCSKLVSQRFGGSEAELIGKTDFDLFADEHARIAFEDEQEIIRSGRPLIGKVERELSKEGRESWALTSKMPLRNPAGEIVGTFGISKDITAIKQAEADLETAHKELVQASRLAGMAEVATNVLHNVGNVLNSINVSASLVDEQIRTSRVVDVGRLAKLLMEHTEDRVAFLTSDPKGQKIPGFIGQLAEKLASEHEAMVQEISSLRRNVEHVKEIIAMQQSYARVAGVFETMPVTDLLEDALRMNAGSLARHQVKVVRDFKALPPICTDKHKVLQILINLVRNAKYACDESGREDKQIIMRVANGDGRVKIAVIDNGVGIPPENLTRIFNHGFTTRKDGHGFGLHSGALAAKELGGSLTAQSDGHGLGAAFTLELPFHPPASHEGAVTRDRAHDAVVAP
ncbi:MAG: PAS domain S-box protein [Limisphaerales bacterium]